MVCYCIVQGCINRNDDKRRVSYFKFPDRSKKPDLHKAWVKATRAHLKGCRHSFICELHFAEEDFDESYKLKRFLMPGEYFQPILKAEAVPKLQLQEITDVKESEGDKVEILTELLGESYVEWKKSIESNVKEIKVEKSDECVKIETRSVRRKKEHERNFVTDFLMKRPLKPLPEPLRSNLPSIVKAAIEKTRLRLRKLETKEALFSCSAKIPSTDLHCCQQCSFSTFFKICLLHHKKTVHLPIATYGITRLPMKSFKNKEAEQYKCSKCNFVTFSKLIFTRHAYKTGEFHLLDQIKSMKFWCIDCNYIGRTKLLFEKHFFKKRHLEKQGTEVWTFSCEFCGYRCKRKKSLEIHVFKKHGIRKKESGVLNNCEKDDQMCSDNLVKYVSESDFEWFKCQYCNFRTAYRMSLKTHWMNRHRKIKKEEN